MRAEISFCISSLISEEPPVGEPQPKLAEVSRARAHHLMGASELWPFTLYCTKKALQILLRHLDQFPSIHLSGSQSRLLMRTHV